jgi:hypothetical protein
MVSGYRNTHKKHAIMKTPKLIKHGMLYSMLIGSLLIITGCKKEKTPTDGFNKLLGSWNETPTMGNTSRSLHFSKDGAFAMVFTYDGTPTVVSTFSGIFKIKGDSLLVTVKELSTQEGNQPAEKTQLLNGNFFDDATFNVSNSILTLNYITYPADGPVPTQAKFQRQLPD